MKALNLLIITLSIFCLPSVAAKHQAAKPSKAKSVAAPKNPEEFLKDVVTYEGASKIPVLAKEAILIDYNTGKVLLQKHADDRMVPSSMTKMMTSYLIADKIRKGELTLESSFPVSETAWRIQGSKTFVPLGQQVKVADLLRGIIIQSGNDACIVAAEGISGGEVQFAIEMNAKAAALGMAGTKFKNSSGWPDQDHYSTARDLATLSAAVVRDHPEFYKMYQEKDFTFNSIKQGNRNPLLYDNIGCDGIKTGHTEDGGYGVAASCVDGGQRYILVINGLPSMQARADEARKLINWAKENFVRKLVYKKGAVVTKAAPLKAGLKDSVAAIAANDIEILTLRSAQNKIQTQLMLSAPVEAPIKAGDKLGKVIISVGEDSQEGLVVSSESVEKLGLMRRALRYVGFDV